MDSVSAIASQSTQMAQERAAGAAQLLMMKKAMDVNKSSILTLLSSVTPVTPARALPSHIGQNVNTVA